MNRLKFLKSLALVPFLGYFVPKLKAETLDPKPLTRLDRVGIRRLILNIKEYLGTLARSPMDNDQRELFIRQYLDTLVSRGALQHYTVCCLEECFLGSNKKTNRGYFTIQIQPIKAAEWIVLDVTTQ